MKLEIIIASTRPGRIGDQVGAWIAEYARTHTDFDIAIADLAEINLPLFDEPNLPMLGQYTKEHTKAWSKRIASADAFVIVTPEYNFTMPPSLLNAIDYVSREWNHKPAGFVGYGGTGAVRSIQTTKLLLANLNVMPIPYTVNLMDTHAPKVTKVLFSEAHEAAAGRMLNELHAWAEVLLPLHTDR